MISRRFTLWVVLLLFFFIVGPGCSPTGRNDRSGQEIEPGKGENTIEGKEEAALSTRDAFLKETIPPIDQHIPEVLETATFALG